MEYIKPEKRKYTDRQVRVLVFAFLFGLITSFLLFCVYYALVEHYLPEQLRYAAVPGIIIISYGLWVLVMMYQFIRENPGDREMVKWFHQDVHIALYVLIEYCLWLFINIMATVFDLRINPIVNMVLWIAIFVIGTIGMYRQYLFLKLRLLHKWIKVFGHL